MRRRCRVEGIESRCGTRKHLVARIWQIGAEIRGKRRLGRGCWHVCIETLRFLAVGDLRCWEVGVERIGTECRLVSRRGLERVLARGKSIRLNVVGVELAILLHVTKGIGAREAIVGVVLLL